VISALQLSIGSNVYAPSSSSFPWACSRHTRLRKNQEGENATNSSAHSDIYILFTPQKLAEQARTCWGVLRNPFENCPKARPPKRRTVLENTPIPSQQPTLRRGKSYFWTGTMPPTLYASGGHVMLTSGSLATMAGLSAFTSSLFATGVFHLCVFWQRVADVSVVHSPFGGRDSVVLVARS
jgi:hypothetical protein